MQDGLRDYQRTAVESALRALTTIGSAVLQMPTGAGKTKTATEIIRRHQKPVWFICHRQEIERQASAAFSAAGIDHGIVSPRANPEYDKPVQIVSVNTLARRIGDLPLPSLAIWDECHHVAAKSWAAIREQLNGAQNLGLTATPERLDGKGLAEWFNELVVGPSTRELIDAGWLSDFRYFAPSEPDLKDAKLSAGDYRKEDIDKAMNTPVLIGDAIAEYKAKAAGKRALVFAPSVDASKALAARFNADGIAAAHVDGTTPTEERDAAVQGLAAGEIRVLSNVEVFTEGFDLPAIDAVFLLRPTKSLALFLQMIGRALRKADGKGEALIFDHAGLWLDHDWFDLPIEWSLEGGARQRRLAGRKHGPRRCPECKEVRAEREPVCACGYEFPSGREIGEYDGVLTEVRGVVPEGWETLSQFGDRVGVSEGSIRNWSSEGLPRRGHLIEVIPGLQWVKENRRHLAQTMPTKDDCVTYRELAEKLGIKVSTVYKYIRDGLPVYFPSKVYADGRVSISEAEEWLIKNHRNHTPFGVETPSVFAKRLGVNKNRIYDLFRRGLPRCSVSGGVPISEANIELAKSLIDWEAIESHKKDDETDSLANFARRVGVTPAVVQGWKRRGLPMDGVRVRWRDAVEWVNTDTRAGSKMLAPSGHESQVAFAKRIGCTRKILTRLLRQGLPASPHNHPHIQRGLEWVRDNTDIEIPQEAWPSANDNNNQQKVEEAA